MPLSIPSLATLRSNTRAAFAARMKGADVTLPVAVIPKIADIIAFPLYAAYRALVWVSRQLFINSAEAPYLDRRLAEYGLTRIQPTAATGNVAFSGSNGIAIPANVPLETSDGSQQYLTTGSGTITSGTATVAVVAVTPGSAGNAAPTAPLTITTGIAGVSPIAVVDENGLTGGTDLESDANFRARGLARIQSPPQGGAATDFWQWAKDSGVPTRAWVYPLGSGPGTANVVFTIDSRPDNIPLTGDIATVQDYIDAVAPVIGEYTVYAPIADALAITISNLLPNTSATQAAITAQLNALIATVPPAGATVGDGVTQPLPAGALFPIQSPGKLYLSMINTAIEAAGGIESYDLTAPSADVTFAGGHIPAAPTIAFT